MPDSKSNNNTRQQRRRPYKNQHQYLCLFLDTLTQTHTTNAKRMSVRLTYTHALQYLCMSYAMPQKRVRARDWESAPVYVFVCVWLSERHGGWGEGATPARLRCNAPAQRSLHCNREQQTTNAKCSLSHTHTHARQSVFVFGDETPYRRCDVKGVCCNHQRRVASSRCHELNPCGCFC